MKNNLLMIVFDSCRYDTFATAATPNISKLGETERCYSYASWTVPSHHVLLMGVSPHKSPQKVFASEVYKRDFLRWSDRLNIPDISFRGFVPQLSLPAFLRKESYRTHGRVSMPVLNQTTALNSHFDSFKLMESHNDFNAIIDELEFEASEPSFWLLNVGETHYPYTLPGETGKDLPHISGVHGVFKHLDEVFVKGTPDQETDDAAKFINEEGLSVLKDKQRRNVEYLDGLFVKLYERVPQNTHIIVTSDHGELFGEGGYFGHGPIMHEKVFEVFFVEGRVPK